jgi:hypothetical protein
MKVIETFTVNDTLTIVTDANPVIVFAYIMMLFSFLFCGTMLWILH